MNENAELTKDIKVLLLNCLKNGSVKLVEAEKLRDFFADTNLIDKFKVDIIYYHSQKDFDNGIPLEKD